MLLRNTIFRNSIHCRYSFHFFLLHCPLRSVLHTLLSEAATENYSLKKVLPKTKQNPLKVAGYKSVAFVKT